MENMENTELVENSSIERDAIQLEVSPKKKNNIIIGMVIGLIVLITGIVGTYLFFNNSKNIMTVTVNKLYKNIDEQLSNLPTGDLNYNIKEDTALIGISAEIKTDIQNFDMLSGTKVNLDLGLDYKNQKLLVNGVLNESSKEILDASLFINKDKVYADLGNLFGNILNIGEFDIWSELESQLNIDTNSIPQIDNDDIIYLVKSIKDSYIDTLNIGKFSKKNDTIEVDGKSVKVKSIVYSLDEDALADTMKSIADSLLDNSKFIDILSKITSLEKSEIRDLIKELKDVNYNEDVTITLYSTGLLNKVIGFELSVDDEIISYVDYNNRIELIADIDLDKYSVLIDKDKDKYDYIVKINKDTILKGTYEELSKTKFSLSVILPEEELSVEIILDIKNDKNKVSGTYDIKVTWVGEYVQLIGDYSFEINKDIDLPNVSSAKAIDSLTEEELEKILKNLDAAASGTVFEEFINGFMESLFPEDNYEYPGNEWDFEI